MNTNKQNARSCGQYSPLRKWLIGRKLRKLKLDDSQIEKLDALFANARPVRNNHPIANDRVQEYIIEIMAEKAFNREKAAELIRTASDQDANRAIATVEAYGEFYLGLESWQQEQVQRMWKKRRHCASRCCH